MQKLKQRYKVSLIKLWLTILRYSVKSTKVICLLKSWRSAICFYWEVQDCLLMPRSFRISEDTSKKEEDVSSWWTKEANKNKTLILMLCSSRLASASIVTPSLGRLSTNTFTPRKHSSETDASMRSWSKLRMVKQEQMKQTSQESTPRNIGTPRTI